MPEAALFGLEGKEVIDNAVASADAGAPTQQGDAGGPAHALDGGPDPSSPAAVNEDPSEDTELEQLIKEQAEDRLRAEKAAKAAEEAQLEALERASQAKSALLERILRQIAAAEGAKATIADADNRLRKKVGEALEHASAQLEKAHSSLKAGKAVEVGKGDVLLDSAIAEQRVALNDTRAAMRARSESPTSKLSESLDRVPEEEQVELSRQLAEEDRVEVNKRLAELQVAVDEVTRVEASLDREAAELWYQVAEARLEVARTLNETRLALLGAASDERSGKLTGLTQEGRDNLTVAIDHLGTTLSFHLQRRVHDVVLFPDRLRDPLFSGALAWALIKLLLAIALAVFAVRRGPSWYKRARQALLSNMTNRARVKLVESTLALAEDAAPQAGLLGLAIWMRDILAQTGPEPELSVLFGLFIWVLSYQLASKLTHRLVLRLARRRHTLTVPQKLKVLRTIRAVMRFGFLTGYVLSSTKAMVGAGVLYGFMRGSVVVFGAALFLILVSRWREDIVTVYLAGWGESGLARIIAANQGKWFTLPLAVVALVSVAASAGLALGKDFVLGFEQSRKALAYLFQIRVERKAKERGRRVVDVEALPTACRECFVDEPCEDPRFLVDRFEDQASIVERITHDWPINVLVCAPAGGGVTTWLRHLTGQLEDARVLDVTPKARWQTKDDALRVVAGALGLNEEDASLDQITTALKQSDGPTVFVLDELDRTFLRGLNGYRALDALVGLIGETEDSASWIVGGRQSAVRLLEKTRSIGSAFDRRIELGEWSEPQIRELVHKRQKVAGFELSFEDLLVRELDTAVDAAHVVETENGYLRLLWSFAEGNPRTVLHFWLRSLVRDGDGLRVQLHDAPSADDLDVFPVQERFLLQALALHRELTPAEMAKASNLSTGKARSHVARAAEFGFYAEKDSGLTSVTTHYQQASVRYLRRKNLL